MEKKFLLTVLCSSLALTASAASLVNVDVQKTSDNSVNVVLSTTDNAQAPMVTTKPGNKYVLLMPNVKGSNAGAPNLSNIKDVVSDVEIKNVDDGMNGYTKITIVAAKPLNITSQVRKTAPMSGEEKAAKNIIKNVQVNLPKVQVEKKAEVKIEPKIDKKIEPKVEKKIDKKIVQTIEPKKNTNKDVKKTVPVATETAKPKTQIKEPSKTEPQQTVEKSIQKDINQVADFTPKKQNKANSMWLTIIPVLGLFLLAKALKNTVQNSLALKASFKEHLEQKPYVEPNYDNIVENKELNWQEKYKQFLSETKNEKTSEKRYSFISKVDEKRLELEHTLKETPEVYKTETIDISDDAEPEFSAEEVSITQNMAKLKSFANPMVISHRSKVRKELPLKIKEGKFVKLEGSALNMSTRKFANGNLSVNDLVKTGNKYVSSPLKVNSDYIDSSIEEYFGILDKEQKAKANLSNKVADSLAHIKPSMELKKHAVSNPMAKKDKDYLNGLIIKQSFDIDEKRSFHIASVDGVTALVGRNGDDITVFKKFDENVETLKVKQDSNSVYLVKAGSFRSLIDVEKMGMLIEL